MPATAPACRSSTASSVRASPRAATRGRRPSPRAAPSLPEPARLIRRRLAEGGYAGQPSHPVCHGVGARAHEPPYAHQAGGGTIQKGMVVAIEPGVYWGGGGGLRLEGNFWCLGGG